MNTNAIIAQACHNSATARNIAAFAGIDVLSECADAFRAGKAERRGDVYGNAGMAYEMARGVAQRCRALRAGKGNADIMRREARDMAINAAYAAGCAAAF